jgi:hypothetical protein
MYMRGEEINLGIGIENPATRGTAAEPQAFIPARTPSGINVEVTKVPLKETKVSGVASRGSVIVQRKATGNLEFNLRSETIGYLLKSLLGKCTTTTHLGSVKKHLFEILLSNAQYPTVSLAMAQGGTNQDYIYNMALVKSLEIKTPVDDLVNATAEFVGADEAEHAGFTVAFQDTDYYFRPQDITIKTAADVAGLAAAEAQDIRELSITITNNAKESQVIGSVTPADMIANIIDIGFEITMDYAAKSLHDAYKAGAYFAAQITLERTDIDFDVSHNHPKIVITLAKCSIEQYSQDRPLDEIVKDKITATAHYDEDEEEAINIELYNTVADYDYDAVS